MGRCYVLGVIVLLGLVILAGCNTYGTNGHLNGQEVTAVPVGAEVVPVSDERIADVKPVQTVVAQATELDGKLATVSIEGVEADKAIGRLQKLPSYDNESSDYHSGYYIKYQQQVVVVTWAVQE